MAWLEHVIGLAIRVNVYTVLDWPNDVLHFLENLGCWGRDCDFKRRVRTARRPVFTGRYNVEMSAVPRSDGGPLYTSVSE